jgi:DNA-binding XRE family transcriptional regulator
MVPSVLLALKLATALGVAVDDLFRLSRDGAAQ